MYKKLLVSVLIIFELVFFPFLGKSTVWAVPEAPTPPEAPAGPPEPPAPPTAPEPPAPPTAPETPPAPTNTPTTQNPAPTSSQTPPAAPTSTPASSSAQPTGTPTNSPASSETGPNEIQSGISSTPTASQSAANENTGADSSNESTTDSTNNTAVSTNNQADLTNDILAISTSGNNHSNKNTGDASVTSGDASIQGQLLNQANTTQTSVPGNACGSCESSGSQTASNDTTGAGSTNQAGNNVTSDTLVQNNNTANLDTGVIAIADSGHNSANKNTGNAEITSGDSNVGLTVVNVANTDITGVNTSEFNVYDDHNGDIIIDPWNQPSSGSSNSNDGISQQATNDTTGAGSDNLANNNSNTSLTIVNNNNATVANDLVIDATTGHNDASKNTGDATINTGDVNVVANVVNLVNNTLVAGTEIWVATINIFGDLVGDIILAPIADCPDCASSSQTAANSTTGADSQNQASVAQERITDIHQNNDAEIRNQMVINANTGGNNTDKNTGSSDTQTGQVNVQAGEYTVANTNAVGTGEQTWWIVIVNEAGRWVGKIFGSSDGQNVASGGQVDLGAVNDTTGADSTNQASSDSTQTTDITQNNQAQVDNNIVINADTGHNTAEKNTGNSQITTGDVNVMSNVVNYVNNNIVGGKVVVAFVNVFGSWIGNVLPPGVEKPAQVADSSSNQNQGSSDLQSGSSDSTTLTPTPTLVAVGGSNLAVDDEVSDQQTTNLPRYTRARRSRLLASAHYNSVLGFQTDDEEVVDASQLSVDERIAQGIWLTEEDPYLKTTPTPTGTATNSGHVQAKVISQPRGLSSRERWLLIIAGLTLPLGVAAFLLKKRLATT